MNGIDVLQDGFGRVDDLVRGAVADLTDDELAERLGDGANTVAWLVWHLARVQDAQVAPLAGREQVWTAHGWADRFGLPFDDAATGYGQDPAEAARVRVPAELLVGYAQAATRVTTAYLATLSDEDLDGVVDEDWDPPVTRGVRLVSVLGDVLEHAGQAAFVRGVLLGRR